MIIKMKIGERKLMSERSSCIVSRTLVINQPEPFSVGQAHTLAMDNSCREPNKKLDAVLLDMDNYESGVVTILENAGIEVKFRKEY